MDRFEESEALPEVRRFEVGFPVGLGAKLGKFSCEFRYEWGNGISDYVSLKSVTNRYSLIFGYRIN